MSVAVFWSNLTYKSRWQAPLAHRLYFADPWTRLSSGSVIKESLQRICPWPQEARLNNAPAVLRTQLWAQVPKETKFSYVGVMAMSVWWWSATTTCPGGPVMSLRKQTWVLTAAEREDIRLDGWLSNWGCTLCIPGVRSVPHARPQQLTMWTGQDSNHLCSFASIP